MYIVLTKFRKRECGEIGRHDRLKICCLVIGVRVQVPPFPIESISKSTLDININTRKSISKKWQNYLKMESLHIFSNCDI